MNCIIIDDEKVSRILIEKFIDKIRNLTLIASYKNAVEAINDLNNKHIDIIFLDIEMPEMTGIDFIKNFKNLPQIIIISAQEKYAIDAIEYDVAGYLLKPVSFPTFLQAVNKIQDKIKSDKKNKINDGIFIRDSNATLKKLHYNDIIWIESLENYVVITTTNDRLTIHFTMKSLEKQLPSEFFSRIHRSYIINLKRIEAIEDNTVIIDYKGKKKSFPIAKTYKDDLLNKLYIVTK